MLSTDFSVKNNRLTDAAGKRVRLEFGNTEHVNAVRNFEALQNAESVEISIGEATVEVSIESACTECGGAICHRGDIRIDVDHGIDDLDVTTEFTGDSTRCGECGLWHEYQSTDGGELKLIKKLESKGGANGK